MPDKGEEIALRNLDGFCKEVSAIHQIGCELLIICDGRVFADIIGVPDETVTKYDLALREIVQSMHLKFSSLDDIFPHTTHQQKRQQLVDLFGRHLSDIKKNIQHDEDQQRLYCGLTRFLMEDRIWQGRSKNSIQKECKEKAILMMQRNDAYSALVAQSFPNHIRLSIHPHSNTHKFGINLISGNDRWGTPWHNVLVARADGSYQLMKRKEAQERKYTLVWEQGRPSYFVE